MAVPPRLVAALSLALMAGVLSISAASDGCHPNTWFVGVVSDAEQTTGEPREDFALDVDNFEAYRAQLQATYCFDDSHVRILAFKNDYVRNGVLYPKASEKALKTTIAEFGAAANAAPDATLFFFLSSHGIAYPKTDCSGQRRVGGSLSALWSGQGQDGDLHDCELGAALNTGFAPTTRMVVMADCSLCGGFSDSSTAVSGTVPDGSLPTPSGIVRPNRVVITGCAVTTECFGGKEGAIMYGHMIRVMRAGVEACDGFTAPGFPLVQGIDLPQQNGARDGICSTSELFYAAADRAYDRIDALGIQEQIRMKYGFATAEEDIAIF